MLYPYQILLKADSETNFNLSGSTIVLGKGEIGIAYDVFNQFKGLKIGNGTSNWNTLTYLFNNLQDYYTQTQVNNITGLTNYYEKTLVYTKSEIDNNLSTNYYTKTQIDYTFSGYTTTTYITNTLTNYVTNSSLAVTLGDYTTQTQLSTVYTLMSGRTDYVNYYLKTETDAKYLFVSNGYSILTNTNTGGIISSLDVSDYTITSSNSTLFKLYHNSDNSPESKAVSAQADGDYDVYTLYGKAHYKGANSIVNPSLMSIVSGVKGETTVIATNRAANLIGVYGNSSQNSAGNNYGVVGIAANGNNSNIGVLGSTGTEVNIKNLNAGPIGAAVYAHSPNASGFALILDGGKLKVNGLEGWSGSIPVGAQTITVVNGIITNFA